MYRATDAYAAAFAVLNVPMVLQEVSKKVRTAAVGGRTVCLATVPVGTACKVREALGSAGYTVRVEDGFESAVAALTGMVCLRIDWSIPKEADEDKEWSEWDPEDDVLFERDRTGYA